MYIAYLDDAGSTGGNLADQKAPFQLIGAVLMKDTTFDFAELVLAETIDNAVPEEQRSSFEFHASDLWNGNPPFHEIQRDHRIEAIKNCLSMVSFSGMPVIYGAVDKKKLSQQIFSTANPIDIAFRLCAEGIEDWLEQHAPNDLALLIADDSKNKHANNAIKNAFRINRRPVRSKDHNRGKLKHLFDDMFFGDSSDSIGIQMADVCNFVIERHLRNNQETEYLYKIIEPIIHRGKVFPE